jgi:prephenate dehydrogenase
MRWQKVTLVGVGLLGGSLGLALRKRGLAAEVCGYVRRESSIAECVEVGAVHRGTTDLSDAIGGADLIVLCTPLLRMGELALQIAPRIRKGALVTDVGSVKGAIVSELEPIFVPKGATFVGSHPMAGSEKTGVSAARADLFLNAACVVTPSKDSVNQKVEETEALWREVGGRVIRLDPETHDLLVSRSSHLPHVLAAQLAMFVLNPANPAEQGKLCANGFRDSTRIAAGSPEMWRDIAVMNRAHLLDAIGRFATGLEEFRALLERNDPGALEDYFKRAKELRDEWTGRCASSSPE